MGKETQTKGNLAVAKVIVDITKVGYVPFVPIFEHPNFDIIVVDQNSNLSRVQVRHCKLGDNGSIEVKLYNAYSNSQGAKMARLDRNAFDSFAIYCPDTEEIYYIKNSEIPKDSISTFSLRVTPPLGRKGRPLINGLESFRMASKYVGSDRLFVTEG